MGGKTSYDPDLRDGALRDALTKAMVNMQKQLGKRKWQGRIAQVEGRDLYINAGEKSGLQVGTKLDVYRAGKAIIDPVTKMKKGTTETKIARPSSPRMTLAMMLTCPSRRLLPAPDLGRRHREDREIEQAARVL